LRSAGVDLREQRFHAADFQGPSAPFAKKIRSRVKSQLDACRAYGHRHLLLSAFSCGAFINAAWKDAERFTAIAMVANVYKEEVAVCGKDFDVVAFAIYYGGYGDDNFSLFKKAWATK
jgi:hypothetical protein